MERNWGGGSSRLQGQRTSRQRQAGAGGPGEERLTITLPHDNVCSPCFFEFFSNAIPFGINYFQLGCARHTTRDCTRELDDILEKKVRVRLIPTFGMKVASFVDKSRYVCFDFDYDTVLLSLDDDEPDVDDPVDIANALRAIGTRAPNLLHVRLSTWSICL